MKQVDVSWETYERLFVYSLALNKHTPSDVIESLLKMSVADRMLLDIQLGPKFCPKCKRSLE